jgi:hypothetical protein
MNYKIIVCCFLLFGVSSYFLFSSFNQEQTTLNLDGNFDRVLNEVESFGGSMIVSYDKETGEIIRKRRAEEPREFGVMSISEDTYDIKKEGWPEGTLSISRDMSPSDVIEFVGGNN